MNLIAETAGGYLVRGSFHGTVLPLEGGSVRRVQKKLLRVTLRSKSPSLTFTDC